MAWDYLPIQGSSTPSECTFSNASLTNSQEQNHLALDTFEALQILKSTYRNGHISAPVEAENYYHTIASALGGEDGDVDSPATSFF